MLMILCGVDGPYVVYMPYMFSLTYMLEVQSRPITLVKYTY